MGGGSGMQQNGSLSHSSSAAALSQKGEQDGDGESQKEISAVKVVDGEIITNENYQQQKQSMAAKSKLLAQRTGGTGIQRNAAIPEMAPEIDYWVMNAGSGSRLDGKKPAQLKDKDGNIVNEQEVRRQAALRAATQRFNSGTTNQSPSGNAAGTASATSTAGVPKSKRKTRIGGKYSRLKQSGIAFQGSANTLK